MLPLQADNRAIWALCNARRVLASTEFWVLPLGNRERHSPLLQGIMTAFPMCRVR